MTPTLPSTLTEDMSDLHLFIPKTKAVVAAVFGTGVAVHFNDVVGLGSILVAAIVIVVAGVFTLRNNLKSFWKNLAEERGAQVEKLQDDLKRAAQDLVDLQVVHTRDLHSMQEKLVRLESDLALEKAKRDISVVVDRIDAIDRRLTDRGPLFERLLIEFEHQGELLQSILTAVLPPAQPAEG